MSRLTITVLQSCMKPGSAARQRSLRPCVKEAGTTSQLQYCHHDTREGHVAHALIRTRLLRGIRDAEASRLVDENCYRKQLRVARFATFC